MNKKITLILVSLLMAVQGFSKVKMDYEMQLDVANHYVYVTLHASNLKGTSTTFKMPVWAPGYYKIMDYPVNVIDFKADCPTSSTKKSASNARNSALTIQKEGKCSWVVSHKADAKELTITYHVYCNDQSVASAQIEDNRAFLPLNGILMYVADEKDSPVTLKVTLPKDWKNITTGMKDVSSEVSSTKKNDSSKASSSKKKASSKAASSVENASSAEALPLCFTYYAPNFDRLYDSPLLLGNYETRSFSIDGHNYTMAIETPDGFDKWPLMDDMQKTIRQTSKLMGNVPYDDYAFLLMKKGQGGLEHLNSQAVFTEGNYNFKNRGEYISFLSFLTHEYFHLYNVKSIRPIELEPFNYDGEIFSHCLWISEGLTVYYEYKILKDAGIITEDEMLQKLSSHIKDIETHEGQKHQSLRQFSYDIFLNFMNWGPEGLKTTVSYYEKGPVIGMLLDLEIQHITKGKKSLDDVMRLLYNRYYKELQRGFTEEELWDAFAKVAGKKLDGIRNLVDTTDPIDYDNYLKYINCHLSSDYEITHNN